MSLTWVFIFWANSQNLLKLEVRNEQLNDLTRRDALTGVYLIGAFKEKAQQLLDSRPEKFALVYTDFSDFKYINDVFGYDYGDLLLAQYGKILQKELREHELCGRVSADNFVLLLHYKDKSEIAARQAAADLEILRFMHTAHDGQLLPTNCGICCVEDVIEALKSTAFWTGRILPEKQSRPGTGRIMRTMMRVYEAICGKKRILKTGC